MRRALVAIGACVAIGLPLTQALPVAAAGPNRVCQGTKFTARCSALNPNSGPAGQKGTASGDGWPTMVLPGVITSFFGNGPRSQIGTFTTNTSGSFRNARFQIPNGVPPGVYRIHFNVVINGQVGTDSDSNFTVTAPKVTVTKPVTTGGGSSQKNNTSTGGGSTGGGGGSCPQGQSLFGSQCLPSGTIGTCPGNAGCPSKSGEDEDSDSEDNSGFDQFKEAQSAIRTLLQDALSIGISADKLLSGLGPYAAETGGPLLRLINGCIFAPPDAAFSNPDCIKFFQNIDPKYIPAQG